MERLWANLGIGEMKAITGLATRRFDLMNEGCKLLIENLELTKCIFRTNHASNYLPIRGTLNHDKSQLLDILTHTIENENYDQLRPSYLRGL